MRFGALSVQRIHALVHWENPGEEGLFWCWEEEA